MKTIQKDLYLDAATHALAGFQLIEASLKDYVADHFDAVRKLTHGKLTFKYGREHVEDAPLGRLCEMFSKVCENEKLVSKIRRMKDGRNNLAHRALAAQFDRDMSEEDYIKEAKEFKVIAQDIGEILSELNRERLMLWQALKEKQPHEI